MCIYVYTHPVHHRPAQGRLLQQGSKMCMAKRHIILFNMFTNSWRETIEHNNIFWCTIYAQFQTWPWTNRGTAYLERRQGTRIFNWFHFFATAKFWIPPKKWETIWVSIWILLMHKNSKTYKFIAIIGYYTLGPYLGLLWRL